MMFINVDLPEPLAPMMATNSDGRIRRLAPCRIRLGAAAGLSAAHIIADAPDQQLDIATAPDPGERGTIERQLNGPISMRSPVDQGTSAAQALAVDIGAVGAAEVAQHDGSIHYLKRRVTARDIWMIEHDLPRHRLTADRQTVVERQAIGQRRGGRPGRRRDKVMVTVPPSARRAPSNRRTSLMRNTEPLDDGDAVISPQASVRWSPWRRHALLPPHIRRPILSRRAAPERTAGELARGAMAGLYRRRYLLPLFAAVQNCTLDASFAPPRGQPKARRRAGSRRAGTPQSVEL